MGYTDPRQELMKQFLRAAPFLRAIDPNSKNETGDAAAKTEQQDEFIPSAQMKKRLNIVSNYQELGVVLGRPSVLEYLLNTGHGDWLANAIRELPEEQFLKRFSNSRTVGELSGDSGKMFFDRAVQLDDAKLSRLLAMVWIPTYFFEHGDGKRAIDRLDKLSNDNLVKILRAPYAVMNIADAGFGEWLTKKIDAMPIKNQVSVLRGHAAPEGLFHNGQKDWLQKTLYAFTWSELNDVFFFRNLNAEFGDKEAYRDFVDQAFRKQNFQYHHRRSLPDGPT